MTITFDSIVGEWNSSLTKTLYNLLFPAPKLSSGFTAMIQVYINSDLQQNNEVRIIGSHDDLLAELVYCEEIFWVAIILFHIQETD